MKTYKSLFLLSLFLVIIFGCAHTCPKDVIITPLRNKELGPAIFTPDNQTLIFSILWETNVQLYKVHIDGTGAVPLGRVPTRFFSPAISPDGTKVAYSHISDNQGDICVLNSDGTKNQCLTSGPPFEYNPVYSPDGRKVFFLRADTFKNYSPIARPGWHDVDVYSINSDGSELSRFTWFDAYSLSDLSIDRNGEILMVLPNRGEMENGPLWLIPIKYPGRKKIVRPDLEKYRKKFLFWDIDIDYSMLRNPQLSPDGTRILFTWPYDDDLFVMDLETSQVERIWKWEGEEKRLPSRMYPRFSSDGRQISFSTVARKDIDEICNIKNKTNNVPWNEPKIWLINADGTGLRAVDVK